MSRRARRVRYAIVGLLASHGPTTPRGISEHLGCWPGGLYAELAYLETRGMVIGEFEDSEYPRRRFYRIPTGEDKP